MKSLKPRLLTAVVGISLLLCILFVAEQWNPIIGIIVGLASAFMTGEYLNAKGLLKVYELSIPCLLVSFVLSQTVISQYLFLIFLVFMMIAFSVLILSHKKISYIDLAYAVCGTLLISFGMSALPTICSSGIGVAFYFVTVFALPWMADAGGFFIGATMGKHKLCPNISPKKTVEGAVGGVIFCIISALIVGVVFQYIIMPDYKINFWALALLGLLDAPISILGDLSFSLIKRSLNIKDYGSIFPGHGGMLDRFDSIIFTAPVLVAVNQFIPFITQV
ncbi:MAG: phosphatidate cytidylyltransferase [Ruminococcus sp.]|nr:phosphatidate cytidylyltransferase [Ruminococcus sp.]